MTAQPSRPDESRASSAARCGSTFQRVAQRVFDRCLRHAGEGNPPCTRADRLEQRLLAVGDEDDHGVRRRLLERLQQRVRRRLVHRVAPAR